MVRLPSLNLVLLGQSDQLLDSGKLSCELSQSRAQQV